MLGSSVSFFVSWFEQAVHDADTRKHSNIFFIVFIFNFKID